MGLAELASCLPDTKPLKSRSLNITRSMNNKARKIDQIHLENLRSFMKKLNPSFQNYKYRVST